MNPKHLQILTALGLLIVGLLYAFELVAFLLDLNNGLIYRPIRNVGLGIGTLLLVVTSILLIIDARKD
jgi:hypothetical protein